MNLNLSKLPLLRCCFPSVRLLVNAFPISKTRSKISESHPFIGQWTKSTIYHHHPFFKSPDFCKTFANTYSNVSSKKRHFSKSESPWKLETHLHLSVDDRLFFNMETIAFQIILPIWEMLSDCVTPSYFSTFKRLTSYRVFRFMQVHFLHLISIIEQNV